MSKNRPAFEESGVPPRRRFLQTTLLGTASAAVLPAFAVARESASAPPAPDIPAFDLDEMTVADLQQGMASGKFSARSLAEKYLARIDALDKQGPMVNSVIELNPDALSIADALDRERKEKGVRGVLHGIPVLIKDNIDTADRMMTTAGSLAMVGPAPAKDSTVAQKLRAAGAVILGKTNLSEWANIRSSHSTSGWSGRGGLTRNPYALDRNPCGSSSGSGAGVSANFCAVAIGTETDGSVVCPSSLERNRRHQADSGIDQPRGHHPHRPQSRHGWPHGADGARCRDSFRRARRSRSTRPGNRGECRQDRT